MAHLVEARAHHLRLAAQAVGILHARTVLVRRANRAPRKQIAIDSGDLRLPAMAAHRLDPRVERRVAAEARIDGQRAGDERSGHRTLGREQPGERECRRHLRAVQEREPFLRAEHQRLQTRCRERIASRHRALTETRFPFADQDRGQMRERREVARRAYRSLRRNARDDPRVRERNERLDRTPLHAGMPSRQRCGLERDHEAHHRVVEQRAGARRMREHERPLQIGEARCVDACAREQAEARVDAIHRRSSGDHAADDVGSPVDALPGRRVDR